MNELGKQQQSEWVKTARVGRNRFRAAAAMSAAMLLLVFFAMSCDATSCASGYKWEDPDDPDNFHCVKKRSDDGGSGGIGSGGSGGSGVGGSGVGAGGTGAEAGTGGTMMGGGGSGGTGTGSGGTMDPGLCGGTPDQGQSVDDGWAFTDIRPLAQSFTAGASTLSEVSIYVHTDKQLDTFTVYVLGDDAGNPDLADVLGTAEVQNSVVGIAEWLCADIADITVTPGERYWILLNEGESPIRKNWHESNEGGDPYPGGEKKVTNDGGANWKAYPGEDFTFRTFP